MAVLGTAIRIDSTQLLGRVLGRFTGMGPFVGRTCPLFSIPPDSGMIPDQMRLWRISSGYWPDTDRVSLPPWCESNGLRLRNPVGKAVSTARVAAALIRCR